MNDHQIFFFFLIFKLLPEIHSIAKEFKIISKGFIYLFIDQQIKKNITYTT